MGLFSKLFGSKNEENSEIVSRSGEPDVYYMPSESERMNWAIEKANLTLHYFEECLKKPKKGQSYFSIKVKIIDRENIEHIWLTQPEFDNEGNLFGVVGNDPVDVTTVKLNQRIGIDRKLVSDWMIIENGRLIGGYTIRAIRDAYTGRDLANFDKSLGGMTIDDGEDWFKADFTTPEGAILSIENAYDEGNMDKILACKDFNIEAKLMLSKMKDMPIDDELLKQTAEVLKLSFLKFSQEGLPSFKGVKRAFPIREKISVEHFIITEVCYYADKTKSKQRLNTYLTRNGWRVLGPAD